MKKTLLALLLVGCGTLFAETHFSVGIGIGGYGPVYSRVPPPPPMIEQPPYPGEGYAWVDGYWYPVGPRFYWRSGYWRQPAYFGYSEGRGYGGGYGWSERGGYGRDHYDRGRYDRGWRDDRGHRGHNEWRHDDRHEDRGGHHDGNRWRR
jgi:hypothetical protein